MKVKNRKKIKHYKRAKNIILEATKLEDSYQALLGAHWDWYRKKKMNGEKHGSIRPFTANHYDETVNRMMKNGEDAMYWTNNFFQQGVFDKWVAKKKLDAGKVEKPGDFRTTVYYRLGLDIDLRDEGKTPKIEKDRTVTIAEHRKWLEKATQFAVNFLSKHGLSHENIKTYFSGNGTYVTLDPTIAFIAGEEERGFKLTTAFNAVISQIQKEFWAEFGEGEHFVQFDPLNNSCRQWKTILSIHTSKPFACIPLNSEDIEIDLEKANPPLKSEVLKQTEEWIKTVPEEEQAEYIQELRTLLTSQIIDKEDHRGKVKKYGEKLDSDLSERTKITPTEVAKLKWLKTSPIQDSEEEKEAREPISLDVDSIDEVTEVDVETFEKDELQGVRITLSKEDTK